MKRYKCPKCNGYLVPHCDQKACVWLLCKLCILTFRQLGDGQWSGARLRKDTYNV